jgi:hypothetical protein
VASWCSLGTSATAVCHSEKSAISGTRRSSVAGAARDREAFRFLPVAKTHLVWSWPVSLCRVIEALWRHERRVGSILRYRRGAWRFRLAKKGCDGPGCERAVIALIYWSLFSCRHAPAKSLSRMVECYEDSPSETWCTAPCRQHRRERYTHFLALESYRSSHQ